MKKKISIDDLKPGMYVAATNRSWLHLPFFRRKIKSEEVVSKLRRYGVRDVFIDTSKGDDLHTAMQVDPFDQPELLTANLSQSAERHEAALKQTSEMMGKVRDGGSISNEEADSSVNLLMDQIMEDPQSMLCVSVLKNADEFTFNHCVNTAILALFVGHHMNMSPKELLIFGKGALLHDIGKCMIPNEILIKPTKLSGEESQIIQGHVEKGVRYLERMAGMEPEVIEMVSHHHERLDGSGYPNGLKGDAICRLGRLAAVIDVYDALIHENYYKVSQDPTLILKEMVTKVGTHYDEASFKALSDCIGVYPPGTILMLESGEIAIVYEPNNRNPYRPKVLLLTNDEGAFYDKPTPIHLTETEEGGQRYKRSVLNTMSLEETHFDPFEVMSKYSLHQSDST